MHGDFAIESVEAFQDHTEFMVRAPSGPVSRLVILSGAWRSRRICAQLHQATPVLSAVEGV